MSITITKRSEIPNYPLYVMCNDSFMSGWGKAEGMTNTIILPCETYAEAEHVANYADSRTDQKRVRIVTNKPRIRPGVLYSLMLKNEASAWYPHEDRKETT